MSVQEIKSALESLHDPLVHNQALIDCRNLLNLSLDTLLAHFQAWLWVEADTPEYYGPEMSYAIELGEIEEHLIIQGLIYLDA